jgi:hypothetical protein
MTKPAVMPMDSYRLAQYAVPVPCFICGGANAFDSELCRHCQAPMALTHQTGNVKNLPGLIATLGADGAGKTVYLGMLLDMLSHGAGSLQALARGAFSITLQQIVSAALARCEFPEKTPSEPDCWNWVHCQLSVAGRHRPTEVIMPDIAGDALAEEVDHPNTFPVVRQSLAKASGLLILIDSTEIEEGDRFQDCFVMKILSYLSELESKPKLKRRRPRPVALVFTKTDQCPECFENPAIYARERTPGLWQHCQRRFAKHRFFASSVAGACGDRELPDGSRVKVPLRIEPHGIVEPFTWLIGQMGR